MRTLLSTRWLLATLLTIVCATGAFAQAPTIDYLGFGWEGNGLPPSDPGDVLTFVGVADFVDPVFGIDLSGLEMTFHVYDLMSTGEVPLGGGMTMISYVGGMLDVYVDLSVDADWGVFPPNVTAPATFTDGLLFFRGSFNNFTVFFTSAGSGSYEGTLDGLDGDVLGGFCADCAYTWGGAFTPATGAQIPDGYHLQMDGVFELDGAIANEPATWSDVKALYR